MTSPLARELAPVSLSPRGHRGPRFSESAFFGSEEKVFNDLTEVGVHGRPRAFRISRTKGIHDGLMLLHDRSHVRRPGLLVQQGACG